MKILLKIIEKVKPAFKDKGPFSIFSPLFEAIEHFFFASSETCRLNPFVRDPLDLKRYMTMVIIALLPCAAASIYFFGWHVLAMIIVSYMAGGAVEVAFAVIRKEGIYEGFLVTGLIFPLALPPSLPLWMVAVGVAFGVFAGKEIFGGTGRNLFNPAIVGRVFLALAYPGVMSNSYIQPGSGLTGRLLQYVDSSNVDALSSATPLVAANQGTFASITDLFTGHISGSAGETSAMLVILGGLFLVFTKVANWRTVAGTLISFFIFSSILFAADSQRFIAPWWHLFAGGLMYGAFFMATDPVSSPSTNPGKWIYGILIGSVTVLIRNFSGYVEGMMFAILLGNIAAPVIDEVVFKFRMRALANER